LRDGLVLIGLPTDPGSILRETDLHRIANIGHIRIITAMVTLTEKPTPVGRRFYPRSKDFEELLPLPESSVATPIHCTGLGKGGKVYSFLSCRQGFDRLTTSVCANQ
jgi:hypothetical protein